MSTPTFAPFNAEALRSHLKQLRPASPNYYSVKFSIPKVFNEAARVLNSDEFVSWPELFRALEFRCEMTELPGRIVSVQRRDHHGPSREVPTGIMYNTTVVNLIESQDYAMRKLFDAWQEYAFTALNGNAYSIPYYDDFVAPEVVITVFSPDGKRVREYTLHDAYPVSVSPMSLAWSSNDQYVSVPIELSYHKWTTRIISADDPINLYSQDVINNAFNSVKENLKNNLSILSFKPDAQAIANVISDNAKLSLGTNIIPNAQDIVNNAKNLRDLAKTKAGQGLENIAAAGQVLVDNLAVLGKENLPYPIKEILIPAAANVATAKILQQKERAAAKLDKVSGQIIADNKKSLGKLSKFL